MDDPLGFMPLLIMILCIAPIVALSAFFTGVGEWAFQKGKTWLEVVVVILEFLVPAILIGGMVLIAVHM